MIRKYQNSDLNSIIHIWEEASKGAHPFLEFNYTNMVKEQLINIYIPKADTWIYTHNNEVLGFISMLNNVIGGLFVCPKHHRKGIGTQLIDSIKNNYSEILVDVFDKNVLGKVFYEKYGFQFIKKYLHEESQCEMLRLQYIAS